MDAVSGVLGFRRYSADKNAVISAILDLYPQLPLLPLLLSDLLRLFECLAWHDLQQVNWKALAQDGQVVPVKQGVV